MLLVLPLQRLLRSNCIRILDLVILQRPFHRFATACHWYLRPIRVSTYARPIPSVVQIGADERVLHQGCVLAMDW